MKIGLIQIKAIIYVLSIVVLVEVELSCGVSYSFLFLRREILWWNLSRYWKILLWCGRYLEGLLKYPDLFLMCFTYSSFEFFKFFPSACRKALFLSVSSLKRKCLLRVFCVSVKDSRININHLRSSKRIKWPVNAIFC